MMGICQQGSSYRRGITCVKGYCHLSNISRENGRSHFRMRLLLPALCQGWDTRDPSLVVEEVRKQTAVICALPLDAAEKRE